MKTVILALLVVLVVVSQGEALRCYCAGTFKPCPSRVETCSGSNQVCGNIVFNPAGPQPTYEKGCMTASECDTWINSDVAYGICCRTNLCNK